MHLVISQPMLMPWRGMFEQLRLCDTFVFYDDVQLPLGGGSGRGFITRVQIKTAQGIDWLSLPVERAGKQKQLIKDARFAHMDWKATHLGKIDQAYRAAPHFDLIRETVVRPIYALDTESVSGFCMHSMRVLGGALGLAPRMLVSSEMDIEKDLDPTARLLAFCRLLGASNYVTGLGAMNYVDYDAFDQAGVRIEYMDYQPVTYPQLHGPFTPYVSGIDMLFNLGPVAADYLNPRTVYWTDWPVMRDGRPAPKTD
jgi:hypothetical protein